MAWNGSGTYSRPVTTVSPATGGTTIDVADQNTYTADVTAGVNACLAKNGENAATGNLDIGGYRIENIGNGVSPDDCAALGQVSSLIAEVAEGTFSNNANGNPNVSDASFTVSSLTVATWAEIGPTGATNAWPALDDVPADADWIEVKTYIKATNTGTSAIATLYARASGADDEAIGGDNMIAQVWIEDGDSDSKVATNVTHAKIPISTGTLFDVHYTETGSAAPIFIFLTGYGTNP